jgi:hypothetical protein
MFECPLCGKSENRRGNQFTDVSNVVGHIDGSHDDDHAGVRGEELREEIEATADGTEDVGTDTAESDAPDEPPQQSEESPAPRETGTQTATETEEEPEVVPVDDVDDAVDAASETAFMDGYEAARSDLQPVESEPQTTEPTEATSESTGTELRPAEQVDPRQFDGEHCPLCGCVLGKPGEGAEFYTAYTKGILRRRHLRVILEEDDLVCGACDIAIEPDGEMIPGSEYDPPAHVH